VADRRASSNVRSKAALVCELRQQGFGIAYLLVLETLVARASGAHPGELGGRRDVQQDELELESRGKLVRDGQCVPCTVGVVETADQRSHELGSTRTAALCKRMRRSVANC
jgi:hypothetical protein